MSAPPGRARLAAFAAGFFGLSQIPMMTLVVPLWAADLGAGPFWIGIAVSLRAALATVFSIQAGALMDRIGAGRLCTVLGLATCALTLAYPLWPSLAGLMILQTVVGFLQVTCWIGAQAMIGGLAAGNAALMGRFTFVATLGTFAGPLAIGAVWEFHGAWGGFLLAAGWAAAFAAVAAAMPRPPGPTPVATLRIGDLAPRWADYAAGLRLLRSRVFACFTVISAALAAIYAMRHTFLSVYLDGIGLAGTDIGVVFGVLALSGGAAGLTVGALSRRVGTHWLAIAATAAAAVTFATLPLFADRWSLLAVAFATGACTGVAFPLVLAVLSREAAAGDQGLSAGLRATANRTASLTIPAAMGAVIAVTDMTHGFFLMGAIVLVVIAAPLPVLLRTARAR